MYWCVYFFMFIIFMWLCKYLVIFCICEQLVRYNKNRKKTKDKWQLNNIQTFEILYIVINK